MRAAPVLLIMAMIVTGCRKAPDVAACPELDQLVAQNPVADADAAFAHGDHRVFVIWHGYAPHTPRPVSSDLPRLRMAGTSDNESRRCYKYWKRANAYADAYNSRISLTANQHQIVR